MGKVTGSRGSYAKTAERRRDIAQAVLDLVVEKGHRAVVTADVAKRAGLSEPGVLYHFASKDELLLAALQHFDDVELTALPEGESILRARERAVAGVERTNIVRLHTAMSGEASDPTHPAHEYFKQRWRRSNKLMADSIRQLQADGAVGPDVDADSASRLIHATWEGLQNQWLAEPGFDIGAELEKAIVALLGYPVEHVVGSPPAGRSRAR
ncbi:MAG: TetR/AcrR family transcriptional regulator [Microbacteriaceae bacterium]|nr:TetR/AcrR family transcriptional regulator [Microbacteriaceae bacterium]